MNTQNIFIAHPQTLEQINALKAFMEALKIKFEVSDKSPYNSEFVTKIRKSKQEFERGKFTTVNKNDIPSPLCP